MPILFSTGSLAHSAFLELSFSSKVSMPLVPGACNRRNQPERRMFVILLITNSCHHIILTMHDTRHRIALSRHSHATSAVSTVGIVAQFLETCGHRLPV